MPEFRLSSGIAPLPFAHLLEIEIVEAAKEGIRGKVKVRPEMCTAGHILHGGAIMSFADTLGAFGATLNLPEGASGTTTLESKTNFLGSAKEGETVLGHCTPVHIGRRTSVWQTRITTEAGRNVALRVGTRKDIIFPQNLTNLLVEQGERGGDVALQLQRATEQGGDRWLDRCTT